MASGRPLRHQPRSSVDTDGFAQVQGSRVSDLTDLLTSACKSCADLKSQNKLLQAEVQKLKGRVLYLEKQSAGSTDEVDEEESLTELAAIGVIQSVYPDYGLEIKVHEGGLYELIGPASKLEFIEKLNIQPIGHVSPPLPMTISDPVTVGPVENSKTFSFLYPLLGTERALKDPMLSRMVDTKDPIYNLCVIGGFAHFDATGKLICVNGLCEGDVIRFGAPHEFSVDVELALQRRGSLLPVTADHLRKKRERPHLFSWIGPGDPVMETENGCFAYVCGGGDTGAPVRRIYFPVECRGPGATVSPREMSGEWRLMTPPVSRGECRVCMESSALVILKPCSHRALCSNCASRLKHCPICRHEVTSTEVCYDA